MSDFRLTKELRSIFDTVRARVKPDTPEIPALKAITGALADVNDLRFVYGEDPLSEEEMEWIREQVESQQVCAIHVT